MDPLHTEGDLTTELSFQETGDSEESQKKPFVAFCQQDYTKTTEWISLKLVQEITHFILE